MRQPDTADGDQISFRGELIRKATHMVALVIPGSYYFFRLTKGEMLTIMVPVAVLMILIDIARLCHWSFWHRFARRILSPIIREHEMAGDFTGATYILLTVCATIAMFEMPVAVAALAFIIVGDSLAALVGRKFGRHRFWNKSLEGSLACLAGTLTVAALAPAIAWQVAVTGAVVATVVEALPRGVDDNVTVPILSGLSMTLLARILGNV